MFLAPNLVKSENFNLPLMPRRYFHRYTYTHQVSWNSNTVKGVKRVWRTDGRTRSFIYLRPQIKILFLKYRNLKRLKFQNHSNIGLQCIFSPVDDNMFFDYIINKYNISGVSLILNELQNFSLCQKWEISWLYTPN